ncbi:MAG: TatD family hydrolase [Rickettsiaceae bacterium]
MILVDSHCHLDMLTEYDSHDNIVKRAFDSNVHYMQTICTKLENISKILAIAENYSNVFASVGVHPSEVNRLITIQELINLSKHPKIIGLGETGLDYYYNKDHSQQQLQRKSFEEHIKASCESNLPVIVHTREAESDTYDIMNSYKKMHNFPGLIHCFTASENFARKVLDLGFYISIAGIITFKNAEELRSIVKFIPLDRLLLETDSPYLAPVPQRGKTNEPSYVKYVAQVISDLKEVTLEECAEQTTKNFFTLFSKALKG